MAIPVMVWFATVPRPATAMPRMSWLATVPSPPMAIPSMLPLATAPRPPTITQRARRSVTTPATPIAMPFTASDPGAMPTWIPLIVPVMGSRGFHKVRLTPFTRSSPASWTLIRIPVTRGALPRLIP